MKNPIIEVTSAIYGYFNSPPIDVTQNIQGLLDQQYAANPNITQFSVSGRFNSWVPPISDPFPGHVKNLSLVYVHLDSGASFARGISENDFLTINTIVFDIYYWTVISAVYGGKNNGVDVTNKFQHYLTDPIYMLDHGYLDSLVIGSSQFFNLFSRGTDPDYGVRKYFELSYIDKNGATQNLIRGDGDRLNLWSYPAPIKETSTVSEGDE